MVGSEGSLGAIWEPRLTYPRCRFKNLGTFAPIAPAKGEPCYYLSKTNQCLQAAAYKDAALLLINKSTRDLPKTCKYPENLW